MEEDGTSGVVYAKVLVRGSNIYSNNNNNNLVESIPTSSSSVDDSIRDKAKACNNNGHKRKKFRKREGRGPGGGVPRLGWKIKDLSCIHIHTVHTI